MELKDNTNNGRRSLGASGTVALMMLATLFSKGLGLLRNVFMAKYYGASELSNAFSEASHIPLSFFDLLFATAITGCFIPVYNSFKRREDGTISEEADDFACSFFNLVLLGSGLLALIGIVFSGVIVSFTGLSPETKLLTTKLMRIMFPVIMFTGTAYTLTGIMQSRGRYLLPAMISALYNAAVIIYLLFFDSKLGENRVFGLAAAFLVGWLLQLLTLLIPLLHGGFKYKPLLRVRTEQMKTVLRRAPSIMVGSWFIPAALLSAMFFSSYATAEGSVTLYDYANNAFVMVAGTLTYSICNYSFPELSRYAAESDYERFGRTVRTGALSVFALILPFMSAVLFLSREIITALYMRGEFGESGASAASVIFFILIIAMPAFAVIELGSRVFYAKNLGRIPMIAAICGIGVILVSSAVFVATGLVADIGANMIALATVLGYYTGCGVMIAGALRRLHGVLDGYFGLQLLKLILCTVFFAGAMSGMLALIGRLLGGIDIYGGGTVYNIAVCAGAFVPSAAVYVLALKLFRVDFRCAGDKKTIPADNGEGE